jgi:hypothetical protein
MGPIVLGDPGPFACSYHVNAVKQPGAGVNVVVRAIVVEGLITPLIVIVLAIGPDQLGVSVVSSCYQHLSGS